MKTYPANVICSTIVLSSRFTVTAEKRKLICEISDLQVSLHARIYNDACDDGFGIRSEKTGEIAYFVHAHTEHDADGDVLFDRFEPISETLRLFPHLKDWSVVVFND